MILGALIDAGLGLDALRDALAKLHLAGYTLAAEKVTRAGISGTKLHVNIDAEQEHRHDRDQERGRHLPEILKLIEDSTLAPDVRFKASEVFRRLAAAEGAVHGKPPEHVHFHEVGAVDSIVDVVGSVAGLHLLGVERVHSSALRTGTGTVRCAHGELPVPAPATAHLLRGLPVIQTDVEAELTTPTGAAILATLAQTFGPMPSCRVAAIGYGAGSRDIPARPNLLRIFIGDTTDGGFETDVVDVIEANIDDMSPEFFGGISDRLFAAGALDVFVVPIQMKKGRPGFLISAIAPPDRSAAVQQVFFRETTTFGVRIFEARRRKLPRVQREVSTRFGTIRMKIGTIDGEIVRAKPEHDDCARIAAEHGVPFAEVYEAAMKAFWKENEKPELRTPNIEH